MPKALVWDCSGSAGLRRQFLLHATPSLPAPGRATVMCMRPALLGDEPQSMEAEKTNSKRKLRPLRQPQGKLGVQVSGKRGQSSKIQKKRKLKRLEKVMIMRPCPQQLHDKPLCWDPTCKRLCPRRCRITRS